MGGSVQTSEHQVAGSEPEVDVGAELVARVEHAGEGVGDPVLAGGEAGRGEAGKALVFGHCQAVSCDRMQVDGGAAQVAEGIVDLGLGEAQQAQLNVFALIVEEVDQGLRGARGPRRVCC